VVQFSQKFVGAPFGRPEREIKLNRSQDISEGETEYISQLNAGGLSIE
jgi:hypothetical protein